MWSHYERNHTGFCIEYNIKEMKNEERQYLFPIIYCNNRNDVTNSLIKDSDLSDIKTFGYKSKCWKYEKEWRYSYLPARRGK